MCSDVVEDIENLKLNIINIYLIAILKKNVVSTAYIMNAADIVNAADVVNACSHYFCVLEFSAVVSYFLNLVIYIALTILNMQKNIYLIYSSDVS